MTPDDRIRIHKCLESAEHHVSSAEDRLDMIRRDMRSAIIGIVGLDPTTNEIDSLKAQISAAILLVIQAEKIVRATEAVVASANEAVEIARQMHITASKNRLG